MFTRLTIIIAVLLMVAGVLLSVVTAFPAMGKIIAIKTPIAHIPNNISPNPGLFEIPLYIPINSAKEPTLILKNAIVIRNPYLPTAYALVGLLKGL